MRHPILHIMLAALVFISATGLLMNVHYCQGIWKGATLFVEGASCHSSSIAKASADGADGVNTCPLHADAPMPEKDCCDDETQLLKIDQEQTFKIPVLTDIQSANRQPPTANLLPLNFQDARTRHFLNHKPPLLRADPQTELQVFRC